MKNFILKIIIMAIGFSLLCPILRSDAKDFSEEEQKAINQQATVDLRFQYFYKTGQDWKEASYDERENFLKQAASEEKQYEGDKQEEIKQKEKYSQELKKRQEDAEKKEKEVVLKQKRIKDAQEKEYNKRKQKLERLKQERERRLKELRTRANQKR